MERREFDVRQRIMLAGFLDEGFNQVLARFRLKVYEQLICERETDTYSIQYLSRASPI